MNAVAKHEEHNLIPASDAPMIAMIERVVMDPSIPIDRLEKMMELKYTLEDRARLAAKEEQEFQSRKAYFVAMSACQKKLPVVTKTKRNSHTNSNYADLAAIEDQAMPIIHEHGFGVSFQPDGYNEKGELCIKWEISHSDGYVRNGIGEIPVDGVGAKGNVNKTGTQAFGSTATYGRRYLLCMLFNISTGDDRDGNAPAENSQTLSEEQIQQLRDLIEETSADIQICCEKWKVEALVDLPASKFKGAYDALKAWGERQKEQGGSK